MMDASWRAHALRPRARVAITALVFCLAVVGCSEQDRIDSYRPACEQIYQAERERLLANVRAVGRVAIPLSPTYAWLRAQFGKEDGQLPGTLVGACSRFVWRPMLYRDSNPDAVIGACAAQKAEGTFDLSTFREAYFSNRHPSAIEALFDRVNPSDEIRPAAVTIRHPFRGTLAGLPLDVDIETFRRHAEQNGWRYALRREPAPKHFRQDACAGNLQVCNETVDVFFLREEPSQLLKYRLTAGACDGRVQEFQIWDEKYSLELR